MLPNTTPLDVAISSPIYRSFSVPIMSAAEIERGEEHQYFTNQFSISRLGSKVDKRGTTLVFLICGDVQI